jgi:hypothetical protein
MLSAAAHLGFSPASRTRIYVEPEKPDEPDAGPWAALKRFPVVIEGGKGSRWSQQPGDAKAMDRERWRQAWIEAARNLSPAAQTIAARAPLEQVGPKMLELARTGQLYPASNENLLDRIEARAKELDPEAFRDEAERRLEAR